MLYKQKRFKLLKNCDSLYPGDYWKVNAATELNKVIKRDANLLLFVNAFSEKFAEMYCASLVDMFSEYNQIPLDPCSHNFTAIQTSIRLLRRTQFPQEVMNSITQFVQIMLQMFKIQTLHICKQFLNDIEMKGPRINYNRIKALSNV